MQELKFLPLKMLFLFRIQFQENRFCIMAEYGGMFIITKSEAISFSFQTDFCQVR